MKIFCRRIFQTKFIHQQRKESALGRAKEDYPALRKKMMYVTANPAGDKGKEPVASVQELGEAVYKDHPKSINTRVALQALDKDRVVSPPRSEDEPKVAGKNVLTGEMGKLPDIYKRHLNSWLKAAGPRRVVSHSYSNLTPDTEDHNQSDSNGDDDGDVEVDGISKA